MVTTDATISLIPSPYYKYNMRCCSLVNKITQPAISIPLISTGADNTFLFRFTGQSETATINFEVFDDGTDTSAGTYTSPVISIKEQIEYLKNEIFNNDYNTDWYIQQTSRFFSTAVRCVITDLTFDNPRGAATSIRGSMTIMRGNIGNI